MKTAKRFEAVRLADIPATPCPCGSAKRAFVDDEDGVASLHLVEIKTDSEAHFHERLTEIYYVLEGEGFIEADGERVPVSPGSAILIKPGCRHRAVGKLRILNIVVPRFDPDDEWTV